MWKGKTYFMAKETPLIAPAMAQQAIRCIKRAADGAAALITSTLAFGMAVFTLSEELKIDRDDVKRVLEGLATLPDSCLVTVEVEKEKPSRHGRSSKKRREGARDRGVEVR